MSAGAGQEDFDSRLKTFLDVYEKSKYCLVKPTTDEQIVPARGSVSPLLQFWYLFVRALQSQVRNPMDVALKVGSGVIFALASFLVYSRVDDSIQGVYDRQGYLFFICSNIGFGGIQNSIPILLAERFIFVKERYSKAYGSGPYMLARVLAGSLFDLIYPLVPLLITYFYVGLDSSSGKPYYAMLAVEAMYFACAGFGLFFSALLKTLETASALTPVLIVPMFLTCGFFRGVDSMPWFFWPIKSISPFRYCFQALMLNEFLDNPRIPEELNPVLHSSYWPASFEGNLLFLVAEGLLLRTLGGIAMAAVSVPRRAKLSEGDFQRTVIECRP